MRGLQGSLPAPAPRQAFASAGGHAGAGGRHSLHSVHGLASQLPLPPPVTLLACSPGEEAAPGSAAPAQEARCLSPIPGTDSFPASWVSLASPY